MALLLFDTFESHAEKGKTASTYSGEREVEEFTQLPIDQNVEYNGWPLSLSREAHTPGLYFGQCGYPDAQYLSVLGGHMVLNYCQFGISSNNSH